MQQVLDILAHSGEISWLAHGVVRDKVSVDSNVKRSRKSLSTVQELVKEGQTKTKGYILKSRRMKQCQFSMIGVKRERQEAPSERS